MQPDTGNSNGPYSMGPRTTSAPDIILNDPNPEGLFGGDGDMGIPGGGGAGGAAAGGIPAATASGPLASTSIRNLLRGAAADHTAWFRQLDEDYIKPHLLLDQHQGHGKGPPHP